MSSVAVRCALITALEADLVGPFYPDAAAGPQDELLILPPSRCYVTGFLAPRSDRETKDPTADEEFSGPEEEDEYETTSAAEPEPKQKHPFSAPRGLSVPSRKPRPRAPTGWARRSPSRTASVRGSPRERNAPGVGSGPNRDGS